MGIVRTFIGFCLVIQVQLWGSGDAGLSGQPLGHAIVVSYKGKVPMKPNGQIVDFEYLLECKLEFDVVLPVIHSDHLDGLELGMVFDFIAEEGSPLTLPFPNYSSSGSDPLLDRFKATLLPSERQALEDHALAHFPIVIRRKFLKGQTWKIWVGMSSFRLAEGLFMLKNKYKMTTFKGISFVGDQKWVPEGWTIIIPKEDQQRLWCDVLESAFWATPFLPEKPSSVVRSK